MYELWGRKTHEEINEARGFLILRLGGSRGPCLMHDSDHLFFFPLTPPHQILFMLDRYLTWFGLSTVFLSTKKIYFRQPFFNLWLIKQYEFGLHFTKKTALLDSKSLKTARDMYHSWALLFPCKKPWSVLMKSPMPMYKRHVMGRERWK